ncbi:hypothetical protein NKR19_g966 [Coniochaeta hoffmannii]|uniref:Uncharacterized protein n=1 Tax=Coniochaeta hoffmannii TaxID=91930 RepID=A0AA38SDI5_9PEZI|nr:hypothetical protein NKR19_g966 [Coniochaeta hoffmannii]
MCIDATLPPAQTVAPQTTADSKLKIAQQGTDIATPDPRLNHPGPSAGTQLNIPWQKTSITTPNRRPTRAAAPAGRFAAKSRHLGSTLPHPPPGRVGSPPPPARRLLLLPPPPPNGGYPDSHPVSQTGLYRCGEELLSVGEWYYAKHHKSRVLAVMLRTRPVPAWAWDVYIDDGDADGWPEDRYRREEKRDWWMRAPVVSVRCEALDGGSNSGGLRRRGRKGKKKGRLSRIRERILDREEEGVSLIGA